MSVDLQQRNTKYLEYLLDIGVIDNEQHESISQKCVDMQEKKLLFEISNAFANFTASDWFDLSCRIYSNWGKNPRVSERANIPRQSQTQSANLQKEDDEEEYEHEEIQDVRIYGNQKRTASAAEAPKAGRPQADNLANDSPVKKKIDSFCQVIEEYVSQTHYEDLKSHFDHFRFAVNNGNTYDSEMQDRILSQKGNRSVRPSERSNRNAGEKEWHNKLYYDHFKTQAQLEIKREIKRAGELDNCTFTPQVNPIDQDNPMLVNTLRVPVYERLLQAKPAPTNSMLEKQEYRELKGATFQPDISKSQGKNRWQNDKATPEDRMKSATERLYGDAQIKEKIMCLRQMNQKQQENEVYTFSPNLVSPTKNKENFVKTDLTRSVDRLYEENMRRQRKLLKKEVEVREQELEECTFQPERPAKNYKSKNESELDELNAHERLYERFKQRKDRSNNFMQEKELSQRQDNSLRNRSNSVLEGKTPKKSTKEFNNGESVNTPAFDRLYKDMNKRKQKMNNLKEKVKKEEGTTFVPKTNWSRKSSRSISATNRSQQEIRFSSRYESKYSDGGYMQEPISQNNRDSEKLSYKRFG